MKLIKTLFRREPDYRAPATPVYAIGDIHGRLDLLERLIAKIKDHAADLEQRGFEEGANNKPGQFVIERAFVG